LYGGTEPYRKSSGCSGRRKKTEVQAETEMGRWCDGRFHEVGGEIGGKLQGIGTAGEASEEGLGSKGAVVPMKMMNIPAHNHTVYSYWQALLTDRHKVSALCSQLY